MRRPAGAERAWSACPGSPSRRWPSSARCTRTVRLGDSTVVFGRVRAITVWESAVRDGRPRIEHLRPLARLGGNEWSTIGEVKEIRRIPYRSGTRTPASASASAATVARLTGQESRSADHPGAPSVAGMTNFHRPPGS